MEQLINAQNTLLQATRRLESAIGMSPTVQELSVGLGVKAPSVFEGLKRPGDKCYIRRQARKILSILIVVFFLTGCTQSSNEPNRLNELQEFLALSSLEIAEEKLNLLISQCALVVQNQNVERDKLLQAGYEEKTTIFGDKYYNYIINGKITSAFTPYAHSGCSFTLVYGIGVKAATYHLIEKVLYKNGFSRLQEDGGLLKNKPRYKINNVIVVLSSGDAGRYKFSGSGYTLTVEN